VARKKKQAVNLTTKIFQFSLAEPAKYADNVYDAAWRAFHY